VISIPNIDTQSLEFDTGNVDGPGIVTARKKQQYWKRKKLNEKCTFFW